MKNKYWLVGVCCLIVLLSCNLPIGLETVTGVESTALLPQSPVVPGISSPSATTLQLPATSVSTQAAATLSSDPAATRTPVDLLQPAVTQQASRTYDIRQSIELVNDGPGEASRVVLWVALIQSVEPYQQVDETTITPGDYSTVTDQYGNLFAQIELTDIPVGETRLVELSYEVTVNHIRFSIEECSGSLPDDYLDEETYIESDSPAIVEVAGELQENSADMCQTARAIYDYVGDEIEYSYYTANDLGALAALTQGEGDCTEFSDLFIALNRASGIPARFVEGVTCCTSNGYQAGEVKHDWSEVYLPGTGWVPVDATWGRYSNRREQYFAAMTPDHIIVTRGRNLSTLGGYHYYYYRYYWDGDSTSVSSNETWSILSANQ